MKDPYIRIAELEDHVRALAAEVGTLKDLAQLTRLLLNLPGVLGQQAASEPHDQSGAFATRDHVQLVGYVLRVNGREIGLTKRQAVLMVILLRLALAGEARFLTTREIIEAVEAEFADFWHMPLPADVHDVVCRVRKKLAPGGHLLESAPSKGGGIRISTPRGHIEPLKTPWVRNTDPGLPA